MRKGSLEYWPHRRAKKQMPRIRSVASSVKPSFLSFVAVKCGMTHVTMVDNSESPSKGTEVSRAVTLLEIPKVYVYGIRFYKKGYIYNQAAGEVYDTNLANKVGIKKIEKNDLNHFKQKINEFEDVTALAFMDSSNLGFGSKRVMRFEVQIGGSTPAEKLSYIEGFLGKEVKISSFANAGEYLDVSAITKGKGWAGVIKRYGVSRQYRKATGKVRHIGTLGPWHPPKVMFGVPHSGHMGYNYRTELNKRILKVGTQNDAATVNVNGGFVNYGVIKNDFIMVEGTVPGPAKRLLRIKRALRSPKMINEPQVTYISLTSKQGA